MEDETRAFLVLIINSIAYVLLWMMVNVLIGIYFGFAFFEGRPSWKNLLYYVLAFGTLFLILRMLKRKWKL
jgi:ABC-type glycerol-3-phosphate transport system permease component